MSDSGEYEDDQWTPDPVEDFCSECQEWYTDYWCEYCGYHGHFCGRE